jgi:O-acetyl-ADP-ribose deacetylase (regulator of RNase III)
MIHYVKDDITKSDCDIICHQVNCQGAMNSGVAKAIREKWPEVYEQYRALCKRQDGSGWLLGVMQPVEIQHIPPRYVVNLFAQQYYGYEGARYTDYEAFYNSISHLAIELAAAGGKDKTIAFPYKIGCVRGGANWNIIRTMIEEVFEDRDIYFYYLNEEDLEFSDKMLIKEMTLEEIKEGLGINV